MNNEDLTTLYKKRKAQLQTSNHEKRNFVKSIEHGKSNPKPKSWFLRGQYALSIIAVSLLGVVLFQQQSQKPTHSLTQVDFGQYNQIAEINNNENSLTWVLAKQKDTLDVTTQQQLTQLTWYFANQAQDIENQKIVAVKLLKKDTDWYLETCDGETLIQVKQSIVARLINQRETLNDLQTGQWLALALDNNGSPLTLYGAHNSRCS
ncbi:hypothetical protein AAEU29_11620 [Pseudoalteromonas sp. SSM20]|uniref:hypothetical protein n=1 Tax=Pseudoalteromonas sp. SSM20 TaxID=3139394 RepID=UPI003BAAEFCA